jgi:hypothetical protein
VQVATSGPQSHGGITYHTTVQRVSGLLASGTAGVNHGSSHSHPRRKIKLNGALQELPRTVSSMSSLSPSNDWPDEGVSGRISLNLSSYFNVAWAF